LKTISCPFHAILLAAFIAEHKKNERELIDLKEFRKTKNKKKI
jgi:hypothetical protein